MSTRGSAWMRTKDTGLPPSKLRELDDDGELAIEWDNDHRRAGYLLRQDWERWKDGRFERAEARKRMREIKERYIGRGAEMPPFLRRYLEGNSA